MRTKVWDSLARLESKAPMPLFYVALAPLFYNILAWFAPILIAGLQWASDNQPGWVIACGVGAPVMWLVYFFSTKPKRCFGCGEASRVLIGQTYCLKCDRRASLAVDEDNNYGS